MRTLGYDFSVVEFFGGIVESISAKLLTDLKQIDKNITGVHYLHGHPQEIIETLQQKDKSEKYQFEKYPLVCLFQDFPEKINPKTGLIEVSLHIVICNSSRPDYKAPERYDTNFKPILYPIFSELVNAIKRHPNSTGYVSEMTKIDRLYWGRTGLYGNTKNVFNDYLDAIEILNLKINLNTINC